MDFIDLKSQQELIRKRINKRINAVLEHGQYIMGPECFELEEQLAKYVGVKHAIVCSSGTDALLMSLLAHGVQSGDMVVTTPFTFFATAEVISLLHLLPVFVDISPDTYNIEPKDLCRAVEYFNYRQEWGGPIKGIIAVDLFGHPADYDLLYNIAKGAGLFLIEDAAQSFGAVYKERRAGSFGNVGCTSFFPAKPLGCYGDGGAMFTDDDSLAETLRSLRIHGQGKDRYEHIRVGLTGRLDTIQAAILLEKMRIFDEELEERQRVAADYTEQLSGIPGIKTPVVRPDCKSAWAQYSIVVESPMMREKMMLALKNEDIPTMIYYPKPLYEQPVYKDVGWAAYNFPNTEHVVHRIMSLPMHPYLTNENITKIVKILYQVYNKNKGLRRRPVSTHK